MDILMGLVGVIILINLILALSISSNEKVKVRILPKASEDHASALSPLYVVCAQDRLTVGDEPLDVSSISTHADLEAAIRRGLEEIGPNGYVLALVRPDGYDSFHKLREVVKKQNVRFGYEPINSNWTPTR
jgi:hypothetical protein